MIPLPFCSHLVQGLGSRRLYHRLRKERLKPKDLVLVRNSQRDAGLTSKYSQRYLGPYEIVRARKSGSYILKELDGTVMLKAVAGFQLLPYKPCVPRDLYLENVEADSSSEPVTEEDDSSSDSMFASESSDDWIASDNDDQWNAWD